MIEVISLIKGIAGMLFRHETQLAPLLQRLMHEKAQDFIHNVTFKMYKHAIKKNRPIKQSFRDLRELMLDWDFSAAPAVVAETEYGNLKTPTTTFPERTVGMSATQLQIVRSILFHFVDPRGVGTDEVCSQMETSPRTRRKTFEHF